MPFVLLYTTFFTNMHGRLLQSGIWGSLDYWLDQHHVQRGNQPGYYYALLTPLYEFLPLLLALGGAVWLALRGDSLRRWLVFWLGAIFLGLTLAGEKMPWLETHIALPMALVGASGAGKGNRRAGADGRRWLTAAGAAAATALAVLLVVEGEVRCRWPALRCLPGWESGCWRRWRAICLAILCPGFSARHWLRLSSTSRS